MAHKGSEAPTRAKRAARQKPGAVRQTLTHTRLASVLLLGGLCLVTMMGLSIWGERGFLAMWRMQHELVRLAHEVEAIEHENARLVHEIKRLRDDMGYIEKVAREELGLVRPGELVFEFVE
ncbi:Cell division protein FtsB [Candidatus Entotheonellaceae bacterium PAL068K]